MDTGCKINEFCMGSQKILTENTYAYVHGSYSKGDVDTGSIQMGIRTEVPGKIL